MLRLRGGKPVVLFYTPSVVSDVSVVVTALKKDVNLTTVYPVPNRITSTSYSWDNITVHPKGDVVYNGREYAYLFWEFSVASSNEKIANGAITEGISSGKTFCVNSSSVGEFLDHQLGILGLNVRERQDMITFWLAEMQLRSHVLIRFLPCADVDDHVSLSVNSKSIPVSVSRLYMAFRCCDSGEAEVAVNAGANIVPGILDDVPAVQTASKNNALCVIEWGAVQCSGGSKFN